MRRVDDRIDALGLKIGGQTLDAAEAADPARDRRRRGIDRGARQRQDRCKIRRIGDPPRKRRTLRRAAENEQTKAVQRAAP